MVQHVTRVNRSPTPVSQPRILFICGSINQTSQLHAVATRLPECAAYFSPFYAEGLRGWLGLSGLLEWTILGKRMRERCRAYLRAHGLALDESGRNGPYDLIVTCTDLLIPRDLPEDRVLVVQEGMLDTETLWSWCVDRLRLPPYLCGTTLTGTRGHYARLCVASEGFRDLLIARGAPRDKLRVTGIPNFDHCAAFHDNALPERDYVLVCTSDLRETFRWDRRERFLRRALKIAAGRPLHVKFHPNENQTRARRELLALCPTARIHTSASTEQLIANCAVLITQVSSVTFVGLVLGKEVHSDLDLAELRRLLPLQNGATSAERIAQVCRELLPQPTPLRLLHGAGAAQKARP